MKFIPIIFNVEIFVDQGFLITLHFFLIDIMRYYTNAIFIFFFAIRGNNINGSSKIDNLNKFFVFVKRTTIAIFNGLQYILLLPV